MNGSKRFAKPSKRKLISAFVKESKILFKENPSLKSFGWDQYTEYGGRSCGTYFTVRNEACDTYINGISLHELSDGMIEKPKDGLRLITALHREYTSFTKKLERIKKTKEKPVKKERLTEINMIFPTLSEEECDFAKNDRAEKIKELETSIDEIMADIGEELSYILIDLMERLGKQGNKKYQDYYSKHIKPIKTGPLFRYTDEMLHELLQIFTEICRLTEIVENALAQIDHDLLEQMFGDGTRVTVTANGITTKPNDYWDHAGCCKSICECTR